MKVYKFGGASVKDAAGVRNLLDIVTGEKELFIIVSAMGKTTNALEAVFSAMQQGDEATALQRIDESYAYHRTIIDDLMGADRTIEDVDNLFEQLRNIVRNTIYRASDAELWYDTIVAFGELISTTIISNYLNGHGVENRWVDMRRAFLTEQRHKDANVNLEATEIRLKREIANSPVSVFVGQGFIGGAPDGTTTTLGREGSDYSAAIVANVLGAESMSVWKDVDGILNADPKIFPDARKIERLNYMDTIEMAYSGAQIIHPKTIKPLQQKNIPLYVRPFGNKHAAGSVITGDVERAYEPIMIQKNNQVLLKLHSRDLSFVLEEKFAKVFNTLESHRIKTNIIHNSAVNLFMSVDSSWHIDDAILELEAEGFDVEKSEDVEMVTIRYYNDELYQRYAAFDERTIIKQVTPHSLRIVRHK
ncbi:MAG: aspartate kinase [Alistipes sp.]|jgi:aspartate kinase|nr:aspartate kinase [Alistipes sp.]